MRGSRLGALGTMALGVVMAPMAVVAPQVVGPQAVATSATESAISASSELLDAWIAGDRDRALTVATESAVDALFASGGEAPLVAFRGCATETTCSATLPGNGRVDLTVDVSDGRATVVSASVNGAGAPAPLGDAPVQPAAGAVRPPVIDADRPDPDVAFDGATWWSYSTNTFPFGITVNVPVSRSVDLDRWEYVGDALPALGSWASPGLTWAPGVASIAGRWVLYYVAHDASSGRQCIGRAVANRPDGPFTDDFGVPLVCQLARGGSIDPDPFVDEHGRNWLLWKSDDNALGQPTVLWMQQLSGDGISLTGAPVAVLSAGAAWENGIVENPSMVRVDGRLWLFYSGAWWESRDAAVGYASCPGPAQPCTKATTGAPWMSAASTGVPGIAGAAVLTARGRQPLAIFHGWRGAVGYAGGGFRATFVEPLDFSRGSPDWRPDWARGRRLASAPTSGPTALGATAGRSVLFRGEDSSLWIVRDDPAAVAVRLGGEIVGEPDVAWAGDRADVVARGLDGTVWWRTGVGGHWGPWVPLGGQTPFAPSIASWGPGRLDVVAAGLDGQLFIRSSGDGGGTWTPWSPLGGILTAGPDVTTWGSGRLDIVARGRDGAVWHRYASTGSWSEWTSLGGVALGGPSATSAAGNRLDVVARGSDGRLFSMRWDGSRWVPWSPLGGSSDTDPELVSANGVTVVDAKGLDGAIWRNGRASPDGAFGGWLPMPSSP